MDAAALQRQLEEISNDLVFAKNPARREHLNNQYKEIEAKLAALKQQQQGPSASSYLSATSALPSQPYSLPGAASTPAPVAQQTVVSPLVQQQFMQLQQQLNQLQFQYQQFQQQPNTPATQQTLFLLQQQIQQIQQYMVQLIQQQQQQAQQQQAMGHGVGVGGGLSAQPSLSTGLASQSTSSGSLHQMGAGAQQPYGSASSQSYSAQILQQQQQAALQQQQQAALLQQQQQKQQQEAALQQQQQAALLQQQKQQQEQAAALQRQQQEAAKRQQELILQQQQQAALLQQQKQQQEAALLQQQQEQKRQQEAAALLQKQQQEALQQQEQKRQQEAAAAAQRQQQEALQRQQQQQQEQKRQQEAAAALQRQQQQEQQLALLQQQQAQQQAAFLKQQQEAQQIALLQQQQQQQQAALQQHQQTPLPHVPSTQQQQQPPQPHRQPPSATDDRESEASSARAAAIAALHSTMNPAASAQKNGSPGSRRVAPGRATTASVTGSRSASLDSVAAKPTPGPGQYGSSSSSSSSQQRPPSGPAQSVPSYSLPKPTSGVGSAGRASVSPAGPGRGASPLPPVPSGADPLGKKPLPPVPGNPQIVGAADFNKAIDELTVYRQNLLVLQKSIQQQQAQVQQREQKLEQKENDLTEREVRLQSTQLQLEQQHQALKRQEERLKANEAANNSQVEKRLVEWEKALESREKNLSMRAQLLQQRESAIRAREAKVKQQEEEQKNFFVFAAADIPDRPPPPPPPDIDLDSYPIESVVLLQKCIRQYLFVLKLNDAIVELNDGGRAKDDVQTQNRSKAIEEILTTERNYTESLRHVIEKYIEPIKNEGIIKKNEVTEIFSNIEVLYQINAEFCQSLQAAVEAELSSNAGGSILGEAFKRVAPVMSVYTEYIQNFDTSTDVRKKLYKNAQFKSFLRKLQDASGQSSMDLDTYLIMPVQRLPRYRLLLEAVLKYTPENTVDHRVLEEARNSIASVIMAINEQKREEENKQVVIGIQKRISGCNDIVIPWRRFIKEGILFEVPPDASSGTGVKKELTCFLFSDVLIITKRKRVRKTLVYVDRIDLNAAQGSLQDIPDNYRIWNSFSLTVPERAWYFMAETNDAKYGWVDALKDTMDKLLHD